MKLPNAEMAIVEEGKIVEYLLNPLHKYGASKARFFLEFGYRIETWQDLAANLRWHGQTYEVRKVHETVFGPRFEIVGELNAPDGRRPRICTVWQMDTGQFAPRLITAYPIEASYD